MSRLPIARLVAAALLALSFPAVAGQIDLDLPGALHRAHEYAPAATVGRGDLAIARAAVTGAAVTFVDNPEVEAGVGPRLTAARPWDAEVRVEQNLDPGRRSPRREVARAGVAQAQAAIGASLRELDLEVTTSFYEALFAQRAAELAQHAEDLARVAAEAAVRRRKAGEVTDLDANLVRSAFGRARSATQAAHAERSTALGRLGALVGAAPDDTIVLRGELAPPPLPDLPATTSRADIRALEAEHALAGAEHDQAIANGRPQLALWAAYQREDTDSIVLGGVRMTLPLWNRAQGDKAAALAKQRRASETRAVTLRAADRQLADARAAYLAAREATDTFEKEVVPLLDDSEQLLEKTIDAGQIAVSDYLVARQEILDGRREYLARLLALAKAAATVRFVAGGAS
jgi:cobalt-zinc-cadmium efflux system outer membrane protein